MNSLSPRILHILPHAGGGVGTVLRGLLRAEASNSQGAYQHEVLVLESLNETTGTCLDQLGIPWAEKASASLIHERVLGTDLVLVHWWNHPQLMQLLFQGLPASRLAFWSHVNGYEAPQSFFPELFAMSDIFIFATPASMAAPVVKSLSDKQKNQLRVIQSCAGVPVGGEVLSPKSSPFQVGYIGTVEPAKMHRDFLGMCAKAALELPCLVAGGPAHQALQQEAEDSGLASQFEILGPVSDPRGFFQRLHVLAYPLVPHHYGTGEQVLIEAMAYGAVPVTLANPPEQALIQHMETGILANSPAEFTEALNYLASHPAERERMALAGHNYVLEHCPIEKTQQHFHQVFTELLMLPRQTHKLEIPDIAGVSTGSPFHLYLTACGPAPERTMALALQNQEALPDRPWPVSFYYLTRGAPAHYLNLLGYDRELATLCELCKLPVNPALQFRSVS